MKRLLLPFALLFSAGLAHAADPKLPFEKYQLENGLEVILSQNKQVPVVHVQVWYHVGSKDEQTGKTGFAHLFEHMMFQGSRNIAEDTWFKKLDAIGGSSINGTTNTERTNYFESVPSHQLALALWMESDRMGYLLDKLTDASFKNQQDVVRNERRQSYEMRAYGMMHKATLEALYPTSHPYHHTTIGEHEDLEKAKLDDVKQFFRTYYVPSNATLAIVGDFDPAQAKALVAKYFGPLATVKAPARPKVDQAAKATMGTVAMEANVQLPRFDYEWRGPVSFGPDEAELDLAAIMMAAGKSSRFHKRLVYDDKIAQSVNASADSLEYGGDFGISVTMKPGHTIDEGRRVLDEELARIYSQPFTQAELDRAKTKWEANFIRELETNVGRAGMLQMANHYTHDPARAVGELEHYRSVTLANVQAATKRWLTSQKLVLTIVPNKEAPLGGRVITAAVKTANGTTQNVKADANAVVASVKTAEHATAPIPSATPGSAEPPTPISPTDAWRASAPTGGTPAEIKLPAAKHGKLSNGLELFVVENHELPIVESYLLVYAGAERLSGAKNGLADLTAGLMPEGTQKHDALALADALDAIGARLNAGASHDAAFVSVNALTKHLDAALDLFTEVVTQPAFEQKEFARIRDQRLVSILQQRDQPAVIASNVASRVVYGDAHPYAWPLIGSEDALKSYTRDDVVTFYGANYRPSNAKLIVVGDTTLGEMTAKLEARLGSWKNSATAKATPPIAPKPTTTPRKVFFVDQPQASQSVIGLAQVGVARPTPDYVPLIVANSILGGAFSSRINMNLREKNGYSYGARSQFAFLRGPGLFFAGGNVRGNVTKEALTELVKEIANFRKTNVSNEELAETKSSLIGKMPARFETNGSIASMLSELLRNNLALDWYSTFAKKVEGVTAKDVKRVANKYITPEKEQVIIVGDKAAVEPAVQSLNLGTIEERTRAGDAIK